MSSNTEDDYTDGSSPLLETPYSVMYGISGHYEPYWWNPDDGLVVLATRQEILRIVGSVCETHGVEGRIVHRVPFDPDSSRELQEALIWLCGTQVPLMDPRMVN